MRVVYGKCPIISGNIDSYQLVSQIPKLVANIKNAIAT